MNRLDLTKEQIKQRAIERLEDRAKLVPDLNIKECINYIKNDCKKTRNYGRTKNTIRNSNNS